MKKLLTIIALALAINSQAQKIDTVKNAILVKPIVVNAMAKDTAYQLTWSLFNLQRDTSLGCNSYVQIFDRTAKKISELNVPIPSAILAVWNNDIVIDDYILTFLGLKKRN